MVKELKERNRTRRTTDVIRSMINMHRYHKARRKYEDAKNNDGNYGIAMKYNNIMYEMLFREFQMMRNWEYDTQTCEDNLRNLLSEAHSLSVKINFHEVTAQ